MAGNIPSLTNQNYHMYEPSPIETSLASSADALQPNVAMPLLMSYRAQNQMRSQQYQDNIDQMHQIQQTEGNRAYENQRSQNFTNLLEKVKDPGAAKLAYSSGLLPQGADPTSWISGLQANSDATNTEKSGRGYGPLAAGNINLTGNPGFNAAFPGAVQGVNPQIGAATINANGRVAAAQEGGAPKLSINPWDGSTTLSGKMQPGENTQQAQLRMNGGQNLVTGQQQAIQKAADAKAARLGGGGATSLPPAPTDTAMTGQPSPSTAGNTPPPQPAPTMSSTQSQTALTNMQISNPKAYQDIVARARHSGGSVKVVPLSGGGVGFVGLEGTYPIASH